MKYIVTVRVVNEFSFECSAKDSESAELKAQEAWEKIDAIQIDHQKIGKFDHQNEEVEFDVEES